MAIVKDQYPRYSLIGAESLTDREKSLNLLSVETQRDRDQDVLRHRHGSQTYRRVVFLTAFFVLLAIVQTGYRRIYPAIRLNTTTALETCLNNVCAGRINCVSYPTNPLYQSLWVKPYNLDISVTPIAVVRPDNATDVSGIVQCAVQNNLTVQAKSGGHSYA
jgi:hypothetical protein